MLDVVKKNIPVDWFVIITDSETWAGKIHPAKGLHQYQERTGIARQNGGGRHNLERVHHRRPGRWRNVGRGGFDASAPQVIADFDSA